MTSIDIVSGFLGAGKTTFIQRLLDEALKTQKVVLIENEFGEIGIDGGFLKQSGIKIREMNQGCICCSLVGDFETSLKEVVDQYQPDRIIIEPSGVGKLSDIIGAVKTVSGSLSVKLDAAVTVVDAKKAKMYAKNFGEFFDNQIQFARTIVLSRTDIADEAKINEAVETVRKINPDASVITTPLKELDGRTLLEIISREDTMTEDVLKEALERVHCHHHHHEDEEHETEIKNGVTIHHHHEHHHHDGEEHESHGHDQHEHEEHDHHEHEEHDHYEHDHHEHDDHDADEIFTSWAIETPHKFPKEKLEGILKEMSESDKYGQIIRCKGMLQNTDGKWMFFDMVPEQTEIRDGSADYTGKVVVIGADLKEDELEKAFVE